MRDEVEKFSDTKKVQARAAFEAMLDLIDSSLDITPVELVRQLLAYIKTTEASKKVSYLIFIIRSSASFCRNPILISEIFQITAGTATIPQILEIFDLHFETTSTDAHWRLAEENILEEPKILRRNLNDFRDAFYDEQSEATCRIAIDIILIQCRKCVRDKYNPTRAETAMLITPSTPSKGALDAPTETSKKPIKLYPESLISVEVPDLSVPNSKFLVSGRADWTMGYSSKEEDGALFVAVEAKQMSELFIGQSQLITYLAILREIRRKAGKTNTITQGFYSDGFHFGFVCIKNNGLIVQSPTCDRRHEGGLRMVFSFIVALLETALKSTPTATPPKPGMVHDQEINDYDDKVWSKVYYTAERMLVVHDSDDKMDDVVDWSEKK